MAPKIYAKNESLSLGLLPLVLAAPVPEEVLRAYIGLYLREEVQAEGMVRNIGHFSRFLEAISFSHASLLNVSQVARECEVGRKIVEGYLNVLEDLLLGYRLPVFTRRAKRATVAHPKFYYFDAGVFTHIRPKGPLDKPQEIAGAALEGLVVQHLKAWNAYQAESFSLYFWRTRAGVEVDFIVYGEAGFWAIEVKHANKIYNRDLRGLRSFCEDYPEATPLMLYRGTERLKIHGILCLPVEEFLKTLKPGKPLMAV